MKRALFRPSEEDLDRHMLELQCYIWFSGSVFSLGVIFGFKGWSNITMEFYWFLDISVFGGDGCPDGFGTKPVAWQTSVLQV